MLGVVKIMTFDLEYQLEKFREEQKSLFDENGKRFGGVLLSHRNAEEMLSLINNLEAEIKSKEKTTEQAKSDISDLKEAAKPLMVFLAEKFHPHHACIVTSTTCEILEGVMSIGKTLEYVPD